MILSGFRFILKTPLTDALAFQTDRPNNSDFAQFGAIQSNTFEIASSVIETTNKSSAENREILDNHGMATLDLSGSGFTDDSIIVKNLEQNVISQKIRWFLLEREDGRRFVTKCKIANVTAEGAHDGAVSFSISLMSSGVIYITDESGQEYNSGTRLITAFNNLAPQLLIRILSSPSYALADLPSDPAATFKTFLTAQADSVFTALTQNTLLSSNRLTINVTASPSEYAYPILLINKTELENRNLQAADELGNGINLEFLQAVDAVTSNAYFINAPKLSTESLSLKINAG